MVALKPTLRTASTQVLRVPILSRALMSRAARRDTSLILVYHRVGDDGPAPHEVVPTVPIARLRNHLETLQRWGPIIGLDQVLRRRSQDRRPGFAVTFDDDYVSHAAHVLPLLRQLGIPATFFLSGRSLLGLGTYWWTRLEEAIRVHGLGNLASQLGLEARSPQELAAQIESDPPELLNEFPGEEPMKPEDIQALAGAGMEIGFHTASHPVLPAADADQIQRALVLGRADLEALGGAPARFFAYPHGKADTRVADKVEEAGFTAAFTTSGRPFRPGADPYRIGRWEPGLIEPSLLGGAVAWRLNRAP